MIGHSVHMSMRKDHQIPFCEQHRLLYSLHSEPAHSTRDYMKAHYLPVRYTETPGRAHFSAAIKGTMQVYRLEHITKNILLKMSKSLHSVISTFCTIGKEC